MTVLSDANKRLMYDVGVYDNDDDDENVSHYFLFFISEIHIDFFYLII